MRPQVEAGRAGSSARPAPGRPHPYARGSGAAWLALFGVNVLGILPWARIAFPVVDLAETVYQVRRVQLGYVPYRDTFTHHFLGFIVPFATLASLVDLTPAVLKATSLCFNFATAVLLWLTLREVADRQTAWLGAFLTVTVGWFWSWHGPGFNLQSYLAPIIAATILLVTRACIRQHAGSACWAAFTAGVLLTFDQRAIVLLLPLLVPFILQPALRQWQTASLAVLAYAVAPICGGVYLWQAGASRDFVEQTLLFPMFYRNRGISLDLTQLTSMWLGTWLGGERFTTPLLVVGLVGACLTERRAAVIGVWITATVAAAAMVLIGGRPFPNYFLTLGPITIVMVSLIPWYARQWSETLGGGCTVGLVSLGLFCALRPAVLLAVTGSATLAPQEHTVTASAAYLRAVTSPDDGVLVWGYAPQIYVLSDRFRTFKDEGLLSVAGGNFASTSGEGRLPHMVQAFDDYMDRTPPRAIVVYTVTTETCGGTTPILHNLDYERAASLHRFRDMLKTFYRSEFVVTGDCDRAEVFVRSAAGR